jgi:hypothetical protein
VGYLGQNVTIKICDLNTGRNCGILIHFFRKRCLKIRVMLMVFYAQQKMRHAEGGPHNATGTADIQDERETPEIHY